MPRYVFFIVVVAASTLALTRAQHTTVSLRERAEASPDGHYITVLPASTEPTYPDVETLTHLSTLVITGTVLRNRTSLTADGSFINITYEVRVDEIHKKTLAGFHANSTVLVNLPGGVYAFKTPDGRVAKAEVKTPWFKKMGNGKQYVLFLNLPDRRDLPGDPSVTGVGSVPAILPMKPTGGPQGVFEVATGVVKSNSGRPRDPVWQYHNLPLGNFITLIGNAVAKEPVRPL